MKFTKMEGLGNDYVYVNAFTEKVENPGELARRIADRHFGVGGDGLILIEPSDKADAYMHMFNADGSEAPCAETGFAVWQNTFTTTALWTRKEDSFA